MVVQMGFDMTDRTVGTEGWGCDISHGILARVTLMLMTGVDGLGI